MKIYFATTNTHKVCEFRDFLSPHGIEVESIALEIPEVRYEDVADVVRDKAIWAAGKTGKAIVVEDSGLYINALKGFPGSCTKFSYMTIGIPGILALLANASDRSAYEKSAIAFCEPKKEPQIFSGVASGTISLEPRGTEGFAYDVIFIPVGRKKTYAEEYAVKRKISHRAQSLAKFADFLKNHPAGQK